MKYPLLRAFALATALLTAALLPASGQGPSMSGDTTVRIRFDIPAQSLSDALSEFARQAAVSVEVDRSAARREARALTGVFTPPEALRRLLEGTSLTVEFREGGTALIRAAGVPVHTLTPITVLSARSRGYATMRTASATKTDTPLRDTPQSISVVSHQLIADQSMRSMAEVVRYVPGVTMGQGEGHRDAPTIRGNSTTADFYVDGVRDDVQYLRDVYNVERVEALKGPNALIFGRGGAGGVINRVMKEARWAPVRALTVEGGSFEHRRALLDVGQGLTGRMAARVNAMYENTGSFRDAYSLDRIGVNPTVAFALGARTAVHAGYEFLRDDRTVDRGIPSFNGRPSLAPRSLFFGNPSASVSDLELHAGHALVEHATTGGLIVRNRTRYADYDKFYQNSYPGAVTSTGANVSLSAYNNATTRQNLINQTDVILSARTGTVQHTFLVGAELGSQESHNFRNTGYYNNSATSVTVPFDQPTITTPITFRQSASDADNQTEASIAGVYAQDQVALGSQVQLVLGARFDRFDLTFRNHRNAQELQREDEFIAPRAGLIVRPVERLSLYGSYGVSYLPSSGDQFASLSATTQTLEPEQFRNYETGIKWDVRPALAFTAAVYRLDRTNTTAPDPSDPSRVVQTGEQRTAGVELGLSGDVTSRWQVVGGFSAQRARIESATTAAPEGTTVPLVPARTYSLWNRYQAHERLGVGLGIIRQTDMFAAIDNAVTLPGFTRADAAVFIRLHDLVVAQVNVENVFDERYFATSHGNNNIMPGAARTLRVSIRMD